MFSMQEKVIFMTQSPASFLMSVIVITILIWAARIALFHRVWLRERPTTYTQLKLVTAKITNPFEGVLRSIFDKIMRSMGRAPHRYHQRGDTELNTIESV
jgi:hypothetical protein